MPSLRSVIPWIITGMAYSLQKLFLINYIFLYLSLYTENEEDFLRNLSQSILRHSPEEVAARNLARILYKDLSHSLFSNL
jgi:hypothetical protein